jgi:hypothetical protein
MGVVSSHSYTDLQPHLLLYNTLTCVPDKDEKSIINYIQKQHANTTKFQEWKVT